MMRQMEIEIELHQSEALHRKQEIMLLQAEVSELAESIVEVRGILQSDQTDTSADGYVRARVKIALNALDNAMPMALNHTEGAEENQ